MNQRSSRAHAIVILSIAMHNQEGMRVESSLFFADLGGSEAVKRSKVSGDRLREAANINLGLLALKKVIRALNEGAPYVPYSDSKLTMMLSPAVGGDSKTTVLVCASEDDSDATETLQALRFAETCSKVTQATSVNASGIHDLIENINRQIQELEQTIQSKERWQTVEQVRDDEFEGRETVKTSVIVGAEEERKQLEALIAQKNSLLQ